MLFIVKSKVGDIDAFRKMLKSDYNAHSLWNGSSFDEIEIADLKGLLEFEKKSVEVLKAENVSPIVIPNGDNSFEMRFE